METKNKHYPAKETGAAVILVAGWWGHQPGQTAVVGVPTDHFGAVVLFIFNLNSGMQENCGLNKSSDNRQPSYF